MHVTSMSYTVLVEVRNPSQSLTNEQRTKLTIDNELHFNSKLGLVIVPFRKLDSVQAKSRAPKLL